jgi:hypothetical protein
VRGSRRQKPHTDAIGSARPRLNGWQATADTNAAGSGRQPGDQEPQPQLPALPLERAEALRARQVLAGGRLRRRSPLARASLVFRDWGSTRKLDCSRAENRLVQVLGTKSVPGSFRASATGFLPRKCLSRQRGLSPFEA